MYQPTSWEYVQFLYLANDGSVTFLVDEGQNLFDAWMAQVRRSRLPQPLVRSSPP